LLKVTFLAGGFVSSARLSGNADETVPAIRARAMVKRPFLFITCSFRFLISEKW
jgi:hypothetical protein